MKFRTQKTGWQEVDSFDPVASALAGLGWRKKDDRYLCLEAEGRGFAQVAHYRAGQYLAEWRTPPTGKLLRALSGKTLGRIVHRAKRQTSQFPNYEADLLKLEVDMDILLTFWLQNPRPRRHVWRDRAPRLQRYLKLKASGSAFRALLFILMIRPARTISCACHRRARALIFARSDRIQKTQKNLI